MSKLEEVFSTLEGNPHAEHLQQLVTDGAVLSYEVVALLAVAHEIRQAS